MRNIRGENLILMLIWGLCVNIYEKFLTFICDPSINIYILVYCLTLEIINMNIDQLYKRYTIVCRFQL